MPRLAVETVEEKAAVRDGCRHRRLDDHERVGIEGDDVRRFALALGPRPRDHAAVKVDVS